LTNQVSLLGALPTSVPVITPEPADDIEEVSKVKAIIMEIFLSYSLLDPSPCSWKL